MWAVWWHPSFTCRGKPKAPEPVDPSEEDVEVAPTVAGTIASFYYLKYTTVGRFQEAIRRMPDGTNEGAVGALDA